MKMTINLAFCFLFAIITHSQVHSQVQIVNVKQILEQTDPNLRNSSGESPESELVHIDKSLQLTADQFIKARKTALCPPKADLIKIDEQTSKQGRVHARYQQTWNGVPVEGSNLLLHTENHILQALNGELVYGLQSNSSPAISEQMALQLFLNTSGQSSKPIGQQLQKMGTDGLISAPSSKGQLVYHYSQNTTPEYRLAWKFNLMIAETYDVRVVYLDANTGVELAQHSKTKCNFQPGTGNTSYYGQQPISCKHKGHHFELKSKDIETRKFSGDFNDKGLPVTNFSSDWTTDPAAIDVHWGTEKALDFLDQELGRNGHDGKGGKIKSVVGFPFKNAFWNGYFLGYGVGDSTTLTSPTSLDIVGHEYTHAMLEKIVGFRYGGESGAIEEGYCDVFGELIQNFVTGSADWKVGAEITMTNGVPDSKGLRDISNPLNHNGPVAYKGANWNFGSSDNWGVHTNSSVFSHWFYLITYGDGALVNGIGISAATDLIYETLFYLTPFSDYRNLRNSSLAAASALPQFTPSMIASIEAAWDKVNLQAATVSITNISPTDSDSIYAGRPVDILWDTTLSITSVDIEFSINGGVSWSTLAVKYSYKDGKFSWQVPSTSASMALIKIVDSHNPSTRGFSAGFFSILELVALPPVAVNDTITTKQGHYYEIKVWANDIDTLGWDTTSVTLLSALSPMKGTINLFANGVIRIDVNPAYLGTFRLNYSICNQDLPARCDEAEIIVNVTEAYSKKWAMDDWDIIEVNGYTSGNLMDNDYLTDASWSFAGWNNTNVQYGTLTVDVSGSYYYYPSALGRDTLEYFISNGIESDTAYLYLFSIENKPFAKDSMDLVVLFERMNGLNWNINTPVCSWPGVSCNSNNVTSLFINSHTVSGELHDFGALKSLEILELIDVELEGRIPDFSNLDNLRVLQLSKGGMGSITYQNHLIGTLPDFRNLPDLEILNLSNNQISGAIPNFSNLNNLESLELANNFLSGTLPNFSNLKKLISLDLNSNIFTGLIPNFSEFDALVYLNFSQNLLSGVLPDFDDMPNLEWIEINNNQLVGSIPEFQALSKLSRLSLDNNKLSGAVPFFPNFLLVSILDNDLTFSGIEENKNGNILNFNYANQALLTVSKSLNYLTVNPGGDSTLNTYQWRNHDNNNVYTITGTNYFLPTSEGNYSCIVSNTLVTNANNPYQYLVLYSDSLYYQQVCNISLDLDDSTTLCMYDSLDAGFSSLLSYEWQLNGNVVGSEQKVEVISPGQYILVVQDSCMSPILTDTILVAIDSNCVWPGDTNYDGIVNQYDLKNIGLHIGAAGPVNTNSGQFTPFRVNDWGVNTSGGIDLKHVDANGDGVINSLDEMVLIANFGREWKTPPVFPNQVVSAIRVAPKVTKVPNGVGGEFELDFVLESTDSSTLNLYGLAFETKVLAPIPVTNRVQFDGQLFGGEPYMSVSKANSSIKKVDVGFTKIDLRDDTIPNLAPMLAGIIATEKDLPAGDTVSIITAIADQVKLTTIKGDLGEGGQFSSAISGGKATIYFTENLAFVLNTLPAECGSNGRIEAEVLKGVPPYSFLWENGAITPALTDLPVGPISVTVTDSNGNSIAANTTVEGTLPIIANPLVMQPSNGQNNGSITLNLSGSSGFNVTWSNGQVGSVIDSLGEGTYVALVESTDNCFESFAFTLVEQSTAMVQLKVFLEGAFDSATGEMTAHLSDKNVLPLLSPYDSTTIIPDPSILDIGGQDAIVDWVYLELVEIFGVNTYDISCLLQKDGDIVGVDGVSNPMVYNVSPGRYRVVLRHRNHIPALSNKVFDFPQETINFDFTSNAGYVANLGFGQKELMPGFWVMYAGNSSQSGGVYYDVNGNDKALWDASNGSFMQYNPTDYNLDSDVNGLDKIFWRNNSGIFTIILD